MAPTLDATPRGYGSGSEIGEAVVVDAADVVVGAAVVVVVSGGAVVVLGAAVVVVVSGGAVVVVGGCVVGGSVVGGCVVGGAVVGGTVVVVGGGCVVGGSVDVTGGSTGGGGGRVPGSGWNVVGNVVVVEPTPTGTTETLAGSGFSVVGRFVLKPNGDRTDENRPWSCWVTVAAGAGVPAAAASAAAAAVMSAADEELDLRPEVLLRGWLFADALIWGPRALAVESVLPGRMNAMSDTTANTTPATNMVASICSSVVRARNRFRFGTRPIASALPWPPSLPAAVPGCES
jgi:hypothetical protein